MALGKTIALLVIGLIIGGAIGYGAIALTGTSTTPSTLTTTVTSGGGGATTVTKTVSGGTTGPHTYTIGAILPLSGTLADYGKSFLNSVKLAVNQMNANLTAAGSNIQFNVVSADDAGTPSGALQALQSEYQSSGVQVIIGPLTSGEVLGLAQYADQNHIVVLPPAATATSLEIPNDYILRPGQPGDQFEGTALAQTIIQTGAKNVVYIYRDDTSEYGTYNISSAIMINAGLKVDGIQYTPNQADYSAQVQTASSDVQQFLSNGGTKANTVVVLGGYGTEASNIFQHASTDQYLSTVRWYGIEALADNTLLSSSVGNFMSQVNLTITSPATFSAPQASYFNNTYSKAYGQPPEPYSNYAYDNAWIAMLSILAAGSNNGPSILSIAPLVIDHYYGASATGIWLNQYGDQTIAYYNVLECVHESGVNKFIQIGQYNGGTNQLTLTAP